MFLQRNDQTSLGRVGQNSIASKSEATINSSIMEI